MHATLRDLQDQPGRTAEILTRLAQLELPFAPNAWSAALDEVTASQLKRVARRTFCIDNLSCILVGGVTRDEARDLEADLEETLGGLSQTRCL